MKNWNGSIRSSTINTPTGSLASGRWSTNELIQAKSSSTWPNVVLTPTSAIEYLVVGGGGGGGTNGGGGGGAGGYRTASGFNVTSGITYTTTVGGGGAGAVNGSSKATSGSNSVIIPNNSYSFNGTNQYLSIADNAALQLGTGDFTFEAWIYINSAATGTEREIFANWGGGDGYQFFIRGNNRLSWQIYTQNSPDVAALAISTFTWTHIAFSRTSGTIKTFINGALVDTSTGGNSANGSGTIQIGAQSASNYFPGYISNLRLVKGNGVYTAAFTPPTNSLTATQSAGTNINAITGTQTSLLTLQNATIINNSTYALTITNNNGVAIIANTGPFSITSYGGGGGASRDGGGSANGGGSGGGGADSSGSGQVGAGSAIAGQGNNGGAGSAGSGAGGGGGAGAVGGAAGTGSGGNSGNGGIGLQTSISGTATYYAGGGGGSRCPGLGSGGASGGLGGGGQGAGGASAAGTANTGGGGGGDGGDSNIYSGGSGVIIIRYADTFAAATSTTGSPTVTTAGGYRVYKWTSSGSITF